MKADNGTPPISGSEMNHESFDALKTTGDVVAAGFTIAVLAALLPPIAALFTILWTGIRIFETETVQKLMRKLGY